MADPTTAAAVTEDAPPEVDPPEGEQTQQPEKDADYWKSMARKAEKAAKDNFRELEKLRTESMTEQEKAIAAARAEATTEALSVANSRILRAEVKALAGGKLADPADAVNLIDLSKFDVDNDGNVDEKAIASAIDELVKAKPYLAPAGARPAPLPGGGARPPAANNDWMRHIGS